MRITFIGGGNMASALISGLANPPRSDLRIRVVDPDDAARSHLQTTFGLSVYTDTEAIAAIDGADVIFVLDEGRLVARGSHTQLMAEGGLYRTLWELQFKEEGVTA